MTVETIDMSESGFSRRFQELCEADHQVRDAIPIESVTEAIREPGLRLPQIVATVMEGYADRPALGQRAVELVTDATGRRTLRLLPTFETITYRELWTRARAVASAWYGDADHPVRPGDFVAVLGFTSVDYTTVDLACIHLGAATVPLQSGASVGQLTAILEEAPPKVFAVSAELLDHAVDCVLAGATPETLLVFDYHPEDDDQREAFESARRRLAEAGRTIGVESLNSVVEQGSTAPPVPQTAPAEADPLAMLLYTSGSTGTPKGAMYTERLVSGLWVGNPPFPAIAFIYVPMSHLAGRMVLSSSLSRGGTAYFAARSDMSTLLEDFALIRPLELFFVPRVVDLIFQFFQSEVEGRTAAGRDRTDAEDAVKSELRERFMGGRYMTAICGSAPLAAEMKDFIESALRVELHDGYGSTEAGGSVLIDNQIKRPPVIDYKLIDVPELGYFGTDQPYPRGELLLKTVAMIPGYYKRPEVTAEIFDEDGFYRTGDIVAERAPDELTYVDRRNNVLKLSQGEFVAVARLEAIYAASPLIKQIFVYGSSERAYLLAVVVPAKGAPLEPGALKAALAESFQQIARDAELNSYEIPRDFVIATEPFTTANGLLSEAAKLLRPKLKARYGEILEQLYTDIAHEQANELVELRRTASDQPVSETVGRAVRALLGLATTDVRPDAHFTDLGGDSLSALSLSTVLNDIFDVEVPVGIITSPTSDLAALAEYIASERKSGSKRPTFDSVHGEGTKVLAADLTLDKFIDAATLAAAPSLPAPTGTPNTVLLTGANGYLGRFLCLEWLERLHKTGGKLICVVRGSDQQAAAQRLEEAFDTGDAELLAHYRKLAGQNLEVLAGDIGDPQLGLSDATWQQLADGVDLIVHSAALVNHVLPYRQLFGPNVVGTAELIRLALTTRQKPISYLSTVGVAAQVAPGDFVEDGDIREFSAVRVVDGSYANGYGNSKWAGEVLLREVHDLCGLPVAVFRSDMILAHSRFAGQLNVPDMFTRLLLSILGTGIAPYSFYELDSDGHRQRAHYDGLPADFTADAITTLGVASGFRSYDVLNPHDDNISLDRFVDWLIEAGHPIERITDYSEWFNRFETALRAMPESQRQHTVMPILNAYRYPGRATHGSALPAEKFRAAVQSAHVGPDNDIPHLSPELISKYVTDLRLRGLL